MECWEKEGVMESYSQEHELFNVSVLLKKTGIDLWLLQLWAQLLSNVGWEKQNFYVNRFLL